MNGRVLALVGLLAVVVVVGVSCSKDDNGSNANGTDTPTPEATLPPVRSDAEVKAEGKVVPVRHATLSFPVGGTVANVMVAEGDQVEPGQVLMRLDSAQQAAGVLKAMADLAAAQAQLSAATASATETPGSPDQSSGGVSSAALDAARARMDQAQAALEQAQVLADQAQLRAPFAGTVAAIHVADGEVAIAGAPIVELGDESAWLVETDDLTEMNVVGIEPGDAATITVDAIPDLELKGTVDRVSPIGEVRMGDVVYTVVIHPDRHEPRLRWNMTATVTIARGDRGS